MSRERAYTPPDRLERCTTPRGELQLQRRGEHLEVISNGSFLMATYNGASERELVRLAMGAARQVGRVLIGGLGVGYSLAEALLHSDVEHALVIEVEQTVIRWQREYFAKYAGHVQDDLRVETIAADLTEWLGGADEVFDVICLDIDNGPTWLVSESNGWLYSEDGLCRLGEVLAPGGVVAFWSASRVDAFADTLRRRFHDVRQCSVATGVGGEPDWIYLARAPRRDS